MEPKAPATSLDVVSLLELCHNIEASCADLYRNYAECFADDVELRQLWLKTCMEEENHARQFSLAINMRREGVVAAVNLEMLKGAQVLEMVRGLCAKVSASPPVAIDALQAAIRLEEQLSGFHLDAVALFRDDSMRQLFHAMMLADNNHLQAIVEMYKKRQGAGAAA